MNHPAFKHRFPNDSAHDNMTLIFERVRTLSEALMQELVEGGKGVVLARCLQNEIIDANGLLPLLIEKDTGDAPCPTVP